VCVCMYHKCIHTFNNVYGYFVTFIVILT